MVSTKQLEHAARFARLHAGGLLVLPNAWDIPSAALVAEAGFPAIATASAAVAFSLGLPDGERIGRDRMLDVAGGIAARFDLPVSADLEAGYGLAPEDVATTVRAAIARGLVGCNIEDSDPRTHRLLPLDDAVARIRAGVEAARDAGLDDFVLNARTDPWICGHGDADANEAEAIRRANAYLAAGARCAFVPGPTELATVTRLARQIGGPLNISTHVGRSLAPPLQELVVAGVRRASLGPALMLAAYGAVEQALAHIRTSGRFDFAPAGMPAREMARRVATAP